MAEKLGGGYNFTKLGGKFSVNFVCTTCYLSVTKQRCLHGKVIMRSHARRVYQSRLYGRLKCREVQFWAEYKGGDFRSRCTHECNFGVDKRVIEEIGHMLC